jgi:hypothetical protein
VYKVFIHGIWHELLLCTASTPGVLHRVTTYITYLDVIFSHNFISYGATGVLMQPSIFH